MEDVIKLESKEQDGASAYINFLYEQTTTNKSVSARNKLKRIYEGDSWNIIKKRMETEGSVWYVWFMDGVNKLLINPNL